MLIVQFNYKLWSLALLRTLDRFLNLKVQNVDVLAGKSHVFYLVVKLLNGGDIGVSSVLLNDLHLDGLKHFSNGSVGLVKSLLGVLGFSFSDYL